MDLFEKPVLLVGKMEFVGCDLSFCNIYYKTQP